MEHSPVRNLASSVAERHWSSLAIELFLIVAGILIAMSIDNWATERENRREERSYLRAILVDLDAIDSEAAGKLEFERTFVESAEAATRAIRGRHQGLDAQEFATRIALLTLRRTARFDSPAFFDIVSSGRLALIRDDAVKAEILNYFAFTERTELVLEKNSRDFVDNGFMPYARDLGFGAGDESAVKRVVPRDGEYESLRDTFAERAIESLDEQAWNELEVQVHWRAVVAYDDAELVEDVRSRTQELRSTIEMHLTGAK